MGDITRPLLSVGEMCDRGKRVVFGRGGGFIQVPNPVTGEWEVEHEFVRRGTQYELDVLIPTPQAASKFLGFHRQGA